MIAAILVLVIGLAIFWLVFFKIKLLRLTPAWGFGFALVFAHFFLIFLIGLRFEVCNAQLRERHGGAAHDSAHSALARANPGD